MNGIVVGVDGSLGAAGALRFAAEEARLRGVPLHAVCAWHVPALANLAGASFADVRCELEQRARDTLADDLAVDAEQHAIEGTAAQVLLDAADGADLLVVGSRGLSDFAHLLLGSVGDEVSHHAACPVVIVPTIGSWEPSGARRA